MKDVCITLVAVGETADDDVKTNVYAEVYSVGRDEFNAAGQQGMKATHKFVVWTSEYDDQDELEYDGKRLSIYRTYQEPGKEKTELYTAERIGNAG